MCAAPKDITTSTTATLECARDRHAFRRHQSVEKNVQRQQHQPDSDQGASQIARPRSAAALECDDTRQQQDGRHDGDIERQDLDDQRRPYVGAQHDGESGNEIQGAGGHERGSHQSGCGAALEKSGDERPREKGAKSALQGQSEQTPQIGAECAHDPAVDHVQSPEQQRDSPHQVENDCAAHDRATRLSASSIYQGSEYVFVLQKLFMASNTPSL
jgi:hypothetical protein